MHTTRGGRKYQWPPPVKLFLLCCRIVALLGHLLLSELINNLLCYLTDKINIPEVSLT